MGSYPSHLVRQRMLSDRRSVTVRPIRAEDAAAMKRFFDGLSPGARRRRFMHGASGPDEQLIRFYTDVDYDRHMAFVCETQPDKRIVGEARYLGNPDGHSCELGIAVADDWHHSGVAQFLMDALIRFAQARGFETMEGQVTSDNADMLDFVRALGFEAAAPPREPDMVRMVRKL